VARRRLEEQFGAAIGACVDFYDRQLLAWVKSEVEHLVEHFELEAAPIREQIRRFSAGDGHSTTAQDGQNVEALEADLLELRPTNQPVLGSSPSQAHLGETQGTRNVVLDTTIGTRDLRP